MYRIDSLEDAMIHFGSHSYFQPLIHVWGVAMNEALHKNGDARHVDAARRDFAEPLESMTSADISQMDKLPTLDSKAAAYFMEHIPADDYIRAAGVAEQAGYIVDLDRVIARMAPRLLEEEA